jgi:3-oxoacyl-[acyl-carrier-protein] synthase-3
MKNNFPGSILDIEYHLPEKIISNDDFEKLYPDWNIAQAVDRVGVIERHYAGKNETALDISQVAIEKLFKKYPDLREKIDGVIYCTQSADYIMPSNAFLIQHKLKLKKNIIAFDFNLACSGYIYGLMMASSFLKTGICKNILLVTGDTYSKYLRDEDRSTRLLFGDGASASWIGEQSESTPAPLISSFTDFQCASDGAGWDKFVIHSGGCRTPADEAEIEKSKIFMNGLQVLNFVNSKVTLHMKEILGKNEVLANDIDMYLFHQASKLALDSLGNYFKIPKEKTFSNLWKIGNTVSSSIPILIKDYFDSNKLEKDSNMLITGFGVGFSWGSLLAKR